MLIAPIRGWCNRQHSRFWSCLWGFESSPPSKPEIRLRLSTAPSSSGLGRRPLKAVTAVRICSGLPHMKPGTPSRASSRRDPSGARRGRASSAPGARGSGARPVSPTATPRAIHARSSRSSPPMRAARCAMRDCAPRGRRDVGSGARVAPDVTRAVTRDATTTARGDGASFRSRDVDNVTRTSGSTRVSRVEMLDVCARIRFDGARRRMAEMRARPAGRA